MKRVLAGFLFLLLSLSALAQTAPEPPAEKADMMSVVVFGLLFVGACVGYFVYLWWGQRKERKGGKD